MGRGEGDVPAPLPLAGASALSSCLLATLSLHDVPGLGPVLGSVPSCPTGMSPSRRSSHPGPLTSVPWSPSSGLV